MPRPFERFDQGGAAVEVDRVRELGVGLGDRVADEAGEQGDVGDALERPLDRGRIAQVAEDE